jgi:hypothetical protein
MSDEANTEKSIMELPVNGRGCRAFLDGKTLHLQVDLSGQGTPSSSGKTKVIATAGLKGITIPDVGRTVSATASFYIPTNQD